MTTARFVGGPWHDMTKHLERDTFVVDAPSWRRPSSAITEQGSLMDIPETTRYELRRKVQVLDVRSGYMHTYDEFEVQW